MTSPTDRSADAPTDGPWPADRVLALLYAELHRLAAVRMAHERPGHTLSPTALVHEVYLRIAADQPAGWASRAQFFAAAAMAMRRILVENARAQGRLRRGGARQRVPLTGLDVPVGDDPEQVLAVADAVERLAAVDARAAEVANLRIYAGLGEDETAATLETSVRTVRRDWQFARAWLFAELGPETQ